MTLIPTTKPLLAAALFTALSGAVPAGAAPQRALGLTTTGQPDVITLTGQAASVPGFRSARWGMTPEQVRGALASDFGGARASTVITDPITGNSAMIAPMAELAPGPGAAAISYVFDASSKRLIHVNLDWTAKTPSSEQRDALRDAGAKIVAGFVGNQWELGSVMRGVVVKQDLIVLFAGKDVAGGGVDVRLQGVPYTLGNGANARAVAASAGPASLHVGFSAPAAVKAVKKTQQEAF